MTRDNLGRFKPGYRKGNEYTYSSWSNMLKRVAQKTSIGRYENVSLDINWRCFENFLKDMGTRPTGTSLERKDNSKGYCKSNCKWASYKEQNYNKSNTRKITNGKETRALKDWCEILNIKYKTVHHRIKNGWSVDEALNTPITKTTRPKKINLGIYEEI